MVFSKKTGVAALVQKYKLNDSPWVHKGFHGIMHTFFPVGQTSQAIGGLPKRFTARAIFFVADNYVNWYWHEADLIIIREEFFKRFKKDRNYLQKLQKSWDRKIKYFETISRHLDGINLTSLSNAELLKKYQDFYRAYLDEFKYFMVLGDAVSMTADTYLVPEFKKILGADFANIFPKLLTTKYLSFIEEEASARERLVRQSARGRNISSQTLAAHAAKFFYISNNYARGVRLTAADFSKLIDQDIQAGPKSLPPAHPAAALQLKKKLIKRYRLSAWQRDLLFIMDEFFKIQDTRKKYVLIANYYQFEFLKEIARRTKISLELLKYSIFPELADILRGKITKRALNARTTGCACLNITGNFYLFSGQEYKILFKYFSAGQEAIQDFKGLTASLGRARGKVKKILKIHDIINMEKGDILVSSMTRPEMVPAMKLAAGIVTDEGGVTSHAAIISRELKIPCVIGTKIATQVLNDGDEIEVDADKGIIRILKRK